MLCQNWICSFFFFLRAPWAMLLSRSSLCNYWNVSVYPAYFHDLIVEASVSIQHNSMTSFFPLLLCLKKKQNQGGARPVKQGYQRLYLCGEVPGPLEVSTHTPTPPTAVLFSERVVTLFRFTSLFKWLPKRRDGRRKARMMWWGRRALFGDQTIFKPLWFSVLLLPRPKHGIVLAVGRQLWFF